MNIIVCIKQVPDTQKVQVDPKTGVLIREGIETKMNPFDLYAIETALQIKKKTGATLHVITMGPPAAKEILNEAFALGADEAYLLTDRKFAGADVLATSYTLSQGIRCINDGKFDLILCGKQTTDGDTAQVGPAIAEYLHIPHISWVKQLLHVDEQEIKVVQDMGEFLAECRMNYPCLLTVEKGIFQPGLPSFVKKQAAAKKQIHVLTFTNCEDTNEMHYGLSGSPTQVERIFSPEKNEKTERFEFDNQTNATKIYELLLSMKVVEGGMEDGRNRN